MRHVPAPKNAGILQLFFFNPGIENKGMAWEGTILCGLQIIGQRGGIFRFSSSHARSIKNGRLGSVLIEPFVTSIEADLER